MKKIMSVLLSIVIVFTMVPVHAITAFAQDEQPKIKDAQINWSRTGEGIDNIAFGYLSERSNWYWENATDVLKRLRNEKIKEYVYDYELIFVPIYKKYSTVWDQGYFVNHHEFNNNCSYATWENYTTLSKEISLRRIQGKFSLPEGITKNTPITLSSANQKIYSQEGLGDIIGLDNNAYIFVYRAEDAKKITDENFTQYLALWSGNEGSKSSFHGVPRTPINRWNNAKLNHSNGYYFEVVENNLGEVLAERYATDNGVIPAGDYVIDIFTEGRDGGALYDTIGGLDKLKISYDTSATQRAVVKYYKNTLSQENCFGESIIDGVKKGEVINLQDGTGAGQLDYFRPIGYTHGIQVPKTTVIGDSADTEIHVIYLPNSACTYQVEHHKENLAGDGYELEETQKITLTQKELEDGIRITGTGSSVEVTANMAPKDYEHHVFNKDHADNQLSGNILNGNLVLKAYYDRNEYELTYNVNLPAGETLLKGTTPEKQLVLAENKATVAGQNGMERSGYTFKGWNTKENGTGESPKTIQMTGNVELFAKWEKDHSKWHKVSYDPNVPSDSSLVNGSAPTDATEYLSGANTRIKTNEGNLQVAGYQFKGWTNDTNRDVVLSGDYPITTDTVFYAKWEKDATKWHQVSYHANFPSNSTNQEGSVPTEPNPILQNTSITIKGNDGKLAVPGYTFKGWMTEKNGTDTVSGKYSITKGTVFYAKWEKDITQWHKINYDANFPSDSSLQQGTVPTDITDYLVNAQATVKGNVGNLSVAGYVFKGWMATKEGPQTVGETVTITGETTLYAKWEKEEGAWLAITYNKNLPDGVTLEQGDVPTDITLYLKDSMVTLKGNDGNMQVEHYSFTGWMETPDGTTTIDELKMTGDRTVYAKWVEDEKYTLSFDADGGEGTLPNSEKLYAGENYVIPAVEITKYGFEFDGWESNISIDGTTLFNEGDTLKMANSEVTLTAVWKNAEKYTITYDENLPEGKSLASGSAPEDSKEYFAVDEVSIKGNEKDMVLGGYTFLGWMSTKDGTSVLEEPIKLTQNTTLYAKWEKTAGAWRTITYDKNLPEGATLEQGNVPTDAGEYLETDDVTVKGNEGEMVVTGYLFKGWMSAKDGTELVGETIKLATDTTLYAKWEKDATKWFTVSYDANGGSGAPETQEYLAGAKVSLTGAEGMDYAGYTFGGWTCEDIDGGSVLVERFEMPAKNIVLKAQWNKIIGSISVTHKYYTNSKLDEEIVDDNTEIGYKFSIVSLLKEFFNSIRYSANLGSVVVERRPLDAPEVLVEVEPPVAVGGAGATTTPEVVPPTEGETPTEPTKPEGEGTEGETPTEPTKPEGEGAEGETPTEPTKPEGEGTEGETPTEPTKPEGEGTEGETPTEPTEPEGEGTEGETPTEPTKPEGEGTEGETPTESSKPEDEKTESSSSAPETSDSDSKSSEEPAANTSVLAATSEDNVDSILEKEAEMEQEQEPTKDAPEEKTPVEEREPETIKEPEPEVAEQPTEAEEDEAEEESSIKTMTVHAEEDTPWEKVEPDNGEYFYEDGYEYRVSISYYRTVSDHNDHDSDRDDDDDDDDDHSSRTNRPTVTIPEQDVPLAKPAEFTIVDEDVPLGKLPQTGGNVAVIAGSSGVLAAVLAALKKWITKVK